MDEPVEQEEEEIIDREREGEGDGRDRATVKKTSSQQEMVIADVPVHLVFSETISPAVLEELRRQVEAQLKGGLDAGRLETAFCADCPLLALLQKAVVTRSLFPDHVGL